MPFWKPGQQVTQQGPETGVRSTQSGRGRAPSTPSSKPWSGSEILEVGRGTETAGHSSHSGHLASGSLAARHDPATTSEDRPRSFPHGGKSKCDVWACGRTSLRRHLHTSWPRLHALQRLRQRQARRPRSRREGGEAGRQRVQLPLSSFFRKANASPAKLCPGPVALVQARGQPRYRRNGEASTSLVEPSWESQAGRKHGVNVALTGELWVGGGGRVPSVRALSSRAGHFLSAKPPSPFPESQRLAEVGSQGSHYISLLSIKPLTSAPSRSHIVGAASAREGQGEEASLGPAGFRAGFPPSPPGVCGF